MRLLVIPPDPSAPLAEALAAEGFELERLDLDPATGGIDGTDLPGALRAAEQALTSSPPQAVLIGDGSDAGLMAAITAVKLGIPTAALSPEGESSLAARVAHLELPATKAADESAAAVGALVAPTLGAP